MSISSELTLLNNTKQEIKAAINNKGVTVTNEPFAEYPDKIRLIPRGSGIYESDIIQYLEGTMRNVVIPQGTTTIADYAFMDLDSNTDKLETVSIPSSVTSIGKYAFSGNIHITEIDIPSSVSLIDVGAFYDCNHLLSITVRATTPPTLGSTALSTLEPHNNTKIYVPAESVLDYQVADVWSTYAYMITAIPT